MFARVTRITADPARIDEIEPIVREQVFPAAQQMAGFRGMWAMVDRQSGTSLSFTLWESEEAMRASEAFCSQSQVRTSATTGAEVTTERFEVIDHT